LAVAPGLNTTWNDVLAVLENEAQASTDQGTDAPRSPEPYRGQVERRARELIEKARRQSWQTVTWPSTDPRAEFTVHCDGQGRFRCERLTLHGLTEQIVCDGRTLWHLYPELGLGARRAVSRFHRFELSSLVPWAVLPAEDYAFGADVRLVNERTVAIIPHGEPPKDKEGDEPPHPRQHLIFSADGRLAERKLILAPKERVLQRITYGADGAVRAYDENDKVVSEFRPEVKASQAVEVTPDIRQLVVLPMPIRSHHHVMEMIDGFADASQQSDGGEGSRNPLPAPRPSSAQWSEDEALRLIAANLGLDGSKVQEVIGTRFFRRGDRRVGFYTLLLAAKGAWPMEQDVAIGGEAVRMDPLADHPDSPLARYIARQVRFAQVGKPEDKPVMPAAELTFLEQLAQFRDWHARRTGHKEINDPDVRWELAFLERCRSPFLRWVVLEDAAVHASDERFVPPHGDNLAKQYERLQGGPLNYFAGYELARRRNDWRQFSQLFRETVDAGGVPAFDKAVFQHNMADECRKWLRETGESLARDGRYLDVIDLAWQCAHLDEAGVAESLFDRVLTRAQGDDRLIVTAAAIEFCWHQKDPARAERLLQSLLDDPRISPLPAVWRLAAVLSGLRGMHVRQLECLEQALRRAYELQGPAPIDLERFREDYRDLLSRYGKVAANVADLGPHAAGELAARLVRSGDRWRRLEDDPTEVCQQVAGVLSTLGQNDLAWEYVTTPFALKTADGPSWSSLAKTLISDGAFDLADRAYAAAFDADGNNPQHLWDRAQLLQQQGRFADARALYQRIAKGKWPDQHMKLEQDARTILGIDR
jgi:tetratricopeptide (TPR) repeat protein